MEANGVISSDTDPKTDVVKIPAALYQQKISYLWDIKDIDTYDFQPGEYITSSRFYTNDAFLKSDWTLRLYPTGYDSVSPPEIVLVLVMTNSYGKEADIYEKCALSIVDTDREKFQDIKFVDISEKLQTNPIADLVNQRSNAFSLDLKNEQIQKCLRTPVFSILCELDVFTHLNDIKPTVRNELRMFSTTLLKMQNSSIRIPIKTESQTCLVSYGNVFAQIECNLRSNTQIEIKLLKHPEIDSIRCKIEIKYKDSGLGQKKYEWKGKIAETFVVNLEPSGYDMSNHELFLSTTFVAISPKDSFACDFITARQEMRQNYRNVLTQPEFGDVSIHVGGKKLHAHKDILAVRSSVFAGMFNSKMLEATTNSLTVTDFQYETIHAVLKHIYYGMTEVDGVDVLDLFKAADKYDFNVLRRDCEQILCDNIDMDNVINLMDISNKYNAPMLKASVISFIKNTSQFQYD